jgi:ABC-type nitrate/sulfonate/bicarbonate transport system ATPase subunit
MTRELMQEFFLRLFEEHRRTVLFVTSEVEEAIFLADRLVILGNRPTGVRDIVRVPLPRPRHFHMLEVRACCHSKPLQARFCSMKLDQLETGHRPQWRRAFSG